MTDLVSNNSPEPIYTSRIIKASALIADTKVLLTEWDLELPVDENLARARQLNIFGKASRSRANDILKIFRQRYFDNPDVGSTLVTLVQNGANPQWLDPLLYFFSIQNDRTLRDIVTEVIYPRQLSGYTDVTTDQISRALRIWVAEGKTTSPWGDETIARVTRNSLAALRDFGILKGKVRKEIAPIFLPDQSFALIAYWLEQRLHSGDMVLKSDDRKLFFLPVDGVERFFIEAQQEHMLGYNAAGCIVRVFRQSLTAYARFLMDKEVQRNGYV